MKLRLITDTHIGFRPKSHVTLKSAGLYEETVFERALQAAESDSPRIVYHLGDLFHRHSNPEPVIAKGNQLIRLCNLVMSGNHDIRNRQGSLSSLEFLDFIGIDGLVFTHSQQGPVVFGPGFQSANFLFLCHYYTQEQFESAIREAVQKKHPDRPNLLFLHCNVGDGHGEVVADEQSSLYLTTELQKLVSDAFDAVFVGHEHNHRIVRKNIYILGNHFPLSFGEMVDKYVWDVEIDGPDVVITPVKVWDKEQNYRQIEVDELLSLGDLEMTAQFVEIVGEVKAEDKSALSRQILRLWKANEATLLSVRDAAQTIVSEAQGRAKITSSMTFIERLQEEAKAAGFEAEFEEINA